MTSQAIGADHFRASVSQEDEERDSCNGSRSNGIGYKVDDGTHNVSPFRRGSHYKTCNSYEGNIEC